MRLNLGAGDKRWPGFLNVDLNDHPIAGAPDIRSDVRKLEIEDKAATEIHAIHLFEHFNRIEADKVLQDWRRVLVDGGKLVMEVPSLDKIAKMLVDGEKNMRLTLLGLFGDPADKKPDMMHKWCYLQSELHAMLEGAGFRKVTFMEPVFHIPQRDIRVEAIK